MPEPCHNKLGALQVAWEAPSGHGPREGKARSIAAHTKHGRRSRAFVETRKQIWKELRAIEARIGADGYI